MASSYETHAAAQAGGRSGRPEPRDIPRPMTLTAAIAVTELAAVSGLGSAIVTFGAGRSMLATSLGGTLHGSAADLAGALIDVAYKTLQTRAILAVVAVIVLAALAFAARGGRTGVRIGLTIALLVASGIWLLNIRDGGVPGPIRGLDGVALLFSLTAIVLAWLPPNRRFASSRKALRQG
jgi:hypothetical protein